MLRFAYAATFSCFHVHLWLTQALADNLFPSDDRSVQYSTRSSSSSSQSQRRKIPHSPVAENQPRIAKSPETSIDHRACVAKTSHAVGDAALEKKDVQLSSAKVSDSDQALKHSQCLEKGQNMPTDLSAAKSSSRTAEPRYIFEVLLGFFSLILKKKSLA